MITPQLQAYMNRVMTVSRYDSTPVHPLMTDDEGFVLESTGEELVRRSRADRRHVFNLGDYSFKPAIRCKRGLR